MERAQTRGALTVNRVLVVDRDPACQLTRDLPPVPNRELVVQDWDGFFDGYLAAAARLRPLTPFPLSLRERGDARKAPLLVVTPAKASSVTPAKAGVQIAPRISYHPR